MTNYKQIKESLQLMPLSEEEKQKRGILARLYGPCASITDATRNGRHYSDELWEKVFNENEIVREMFENGGCAMELDHPVGREETDSSRIAAMLPEPPKKDNDGHLICYVDLIDTPLGRIAYQLVKYGFKLGISSRGSGDVLPDDDVDPNTYDFTTFDLVLLPAVKDARLTMCESFQPDNKKKLKSALLEIYDNLDNERDKNIMIETLDRLSQQQNEIDLNDLSNENDFEFNSDTGEYTVISESIEEDKIEATDDVDSEEARTLDRDQSQMTVKDVMAALKAYDKDMIIDVGPVTIDGTTYNLKFSSITDDENTNTIKFLFDYDSQSENNNIHADAETATDDTGASLDSDVPIENADSIKDEVIDDKSTDTSAVLDRLVENLKESLRQKEMLEQQIKSLTEEKAVCNAEVNTLNEELDKYKSAFCRTSKLVAEGKKFQDKANILQEQLNAKTKELENLRVASKKSLVESAAKDKIKLLSEKLNVATQLVEEKETAIQKQEKLFNKKLVEKVELAKNYKTQAEAALNEYINYRASMLGVSPKIIVQQLNENYSISNINSVFENILKSQSTQPQFSLNKNARVQINESKKTASYENTYDDGMEDLLILAGLK